MLNYFVYRSLALQGATPPHCQAIRDACARNNPRLGVTGYLHLEDGLFYQYLEGPAEGIEHLREKIARDSRHEGMTVLDEGELESRRFPQFSMAYGVANKGLLFDWISRHNLPARNPVDLTKILLLFMREESAISR